MFLIVKQITINKWNVFQAEVICLSLCRLCWCCFLSRAFSAWRHQTLPWQLQIPLSAGKSLYISSNGIFNSSNNWEQFWSEISLSLYLSGNLQVVYPEMDIDECSVIPKGLRRKISTVWEAPRIFFTQVNEVRSILVCFHTLAILMSFSTVTVLKYYCVTVSFYKQTKSTVLDFFWIEKRCIL